MKGGQKQLGMVNGRSPIFIPGPVETQFGPGRYIYFEVSISTMSQSFSDNMRASQWMSMANSTTTMPPLPTAKAVSESSSISSDTAIQITRSTCCSAVLQFKATSPVSSTFQMHALQLAYQLTFSISTSCRKHQSRTKSEAHVPWHTRNSNTLLFHLLEKIPTVPKRSPKWSFDFSRTIKMNTLFLEKLNFLNLFWHVSFWTFVSAPFTKETT